MPNHYDMDFIVTGPEKQLAAFEAQHIKESALDCDSVIPYPDRYWVPGAILERQRQVIKQLGGDYSFLGGGGFNRGGYDWCVKHWGTKWGTYDGVAKARSRGRRSYRFDSAWGPPTPVFEAVATMWPALRFKIKYYESGSGFCGVLEFAGGKCVLDERNTNYRGGRGG